MRPTHASPSAADVATEANGLLTVLAILTIQLFPISVPLLVLAIGPVVLLALPVVLLAGVVGGPVWLARAAVRSRRARSGATRAPYRVAPARERAG